MNTPGLAWRYLWSRPLSAVLNVLLLALGLASITFLLLVANQVERAFQRDLAGIDVVVGAKGSPMQLILSGVLHLDVPPGNIPLSAVNGLKTNPLVAEVIPVSLGDNFHGYRIVGTTLAYPKLYGVTLSEGRLWYAPMQVVLGATVARKLGLHTGQRFTGAHGLGASGPMHAENPYVVTGVLAPSGTVLDRLILTDTASIWHVHDDHEDDHGEVHDAHHNKAHGQLAEPQQDREVTMALVRYTTPLAAMSFPRWVNTTTSLQAAAPALEVTRLLHMLGLGTDVLRAFAAMLLLTAALSVFIALWNAVRERRADLALLRMLGAPPARIATLLVTEGLWLGVLASVLGLLLGQLFMQALAHFLGLENSLMVGGMVWQLELLLVPALALGVSLLAALLPALGAYRSDVLELLQVR